MSRRTLVASPHSPDTHTPTHCSPTARPSIPRHLYFLPETRLPHSISGKDNNTHIFIWETWQEVLEEYSISLSRSLHPSPLEEPLHSVERERQPHSILRDNTHLYLGNMAGLGIEYLSMPLPIRRGSPFCGENKQPHSIPRDNTHTSIPEKQHHTYIQQRQSSPR